MTKRNNDVSPNAEVNSIKKIKESEVSERYKQVKGREDDQRFINALEYKKTLDRCHNIEQYYSKFSKEISNCKDTINNRIQKLINGENQQSTDSPYARNKLYQTYDDIEENIKNILQYSQILERRNKELLAIVEVQENLLKQKANEGNTNSMMDQCQ